MRVHFVTKRITQMVLTVLFFLPLIFFSFRVRGVETMLWLDPQSSVVWGVDEAFSVNVSVVGGVGIYGWEIRLYYDPNILNGTIVEQGPFLKLHGATFFNVTLDDSYNATHGCAAALCSLLGKVSGVDGAGVLATVSFRTKAVGISLLELRNTLLGDIDGRSLSHDTWEGAVNVFETYHDVAVVSAVVSPLQIAEGRVASITAVVRNKGNKTESFDVIARANDTSIASQSVTDLPPGADSTAILVWNTSGAVIGATYVVRIEATAVPGETDLSDNILTAGVLHVVKGMHNVAVKRISVSRIQVYEGQPVDITVAVANKGDYAETFNLTSYYDDVAFATKAVNGILPGSEQALTFEWNTVGLASNRSYQIKAVANPVAGETDLTDNTFSDGNVTVLPRSMLSIRIVSVIPSNSVGDPVSNFTRGTVSSFKISISSNSMEPEPVLLTVNVYDLAQTTIGVISFKGSIAPGTTTFVLGFPIPMKANLGNAIVYVNALTDWPHLGGVPYCPEASASFKIVGP
jgi:hypothetical protein